MKWFCNFCSVKQTKNLQYKQVQDKPSYSYLIQTRRQVLTTQILIHVCNTGIDPHIRHANSIK